MLCANNCKGVDPDAVVVSGTTLAATDIHNALLPRITCYWLEVEQLGAAGKGALTKNTLKGHTGKVHWHDLFEIIHYVVCT